jgi:N-acetylmuramic acid 6-phosphate etherase
MVNVQATNSKLRERARRIVAQATGVDAETAARALAEADGQVKTAIVTLLADVPAAEARERLAHAGGVVRRALQSS